MSKLIIIIILTITIKNLRSNVPGYDKTMVIIYVCIFYRLLQNCSRCAVVRRKFIANSLNPSMAPLPPSKTGFLGVEI